MSAVETWLDRLVTKAGPWPDRTTDEGRRLTGFLLELACDQFNRSIPSELLADDKSYEAAVVEGWVVAAVETLHRLPELPASPT